MSASSPALRPAASTPAIADLLDYHRDGFLVVRGLAGAADVAELREEFTTLAAAGPVPGLSAAVRPAHAEDPLLRWPRLMHPHRHRDLAAGRLARRWLLAPRIRAVVEALIGGPAMAAQSMVYFKPPGARGQDLHQDDFYLRTRPGACLAAWISIDASDRGNGGMVVVPGSHQRGVQCPQAADPARFFTSEHVPVPADLREVGVDLAAGDALFFHGRLIHGSHPNTSADRFRRAFIAHYVPAAAQELSPWYRPCLDWDGREVVLPAASGGGPCGDAGADAAAP